MDSHMPFLDESESVTYQGLATYQDGVIGVGGKMTLTGKRLLFTSHKINFGRQNIVFPLTDIEEITKAWVKILGIIPIIPNGLIVRKKDKSKFLFAVFNRNEWITLIQKEMSHLSDG